MGNLHYHLHQLKKNMTSMKWAGRLTHNKTRNNRPFKIESVGTLFPFVNLLDWGEKTTTVYSKMLVFDTSQYPLLFD